MEFESRSSSAVIVVREPRCKAAVSDDIHAITAVGDSIYAITLTAESDNIYAITHQ